MAKTAEVILLKRVEGLGAESDEVKVAPGYARNFLIPYGLAISSTAVNKRRREVLRNRRLQRESQELNNAKELAEALSKLTVPIKVKTSDQGKLYGSVTSQTIAEELKTQFDVVLDRRKIHLPESIRSLGNHQVDLHLHADVHATLNVAVETTNPNVGQAEEAPTEPEGEQPPQEESASGAKRRRR